MKSNKFLIVLKMFLLHYFIWLKLKNINDDCWIISRIWMRNFFPPNLYKWGKWKNSFIEIKYKKRLSYDLCKYKIYIMWLKVKLGFRNFITNKKNRSWVNIADSKREIISDDFHIMYTNLKMSYILILFIIALWVFSDLINISLNNE